MTPDAQPALQPDAIELPRPVDGAAVSNADRPGADARGPQRGRPRLRRLRPAADASAPAPDTVARALAIMPRQQGVKDEDEPREVRR